MGANSQLGTLMLMIVCGVFILTSSIVMLARSIGRRRLRNFQPCDGKFVHGPTNWTANWTGCEAVYFWGGAKAGSTTLATFLKHELDGAEWDANGMFVDTEKEICWAERGHTGFSKWTYVVVKSWMGGCASKCAGKLCVCMRARVCAVRPSLNRSPTDGCANAWLAWWLPQTGTPPVRSATNTRSVGGSGWPWTPALGTSAPCPLERS